MPGKIAVILFIIVLLGVGLFIYHISSAPKTSSGFASWFSVGSSSIFNYGAGGADVTLPSITSVNTPPQQTTISAPQSGNGTTQVINPQDIPTGFTLSQLSPFFHEVRIGGTSIGTAPNYGQITLYTSLNASESVDITGWRIKGNDSGEYIPQAINLYDPSGLAAASDIRLKQNDEVFLFSTTAPFNLRINKCIGWIGQIAKFNPPLPTSCPQQNQNEVSQFTGACQNYINTLGSCQQPDMSSPNIPRTDYACQDYLENNFNYKSCFEAHAGDADFLSNQIWVWMGANVTDQYHDDVDLLDRNGLLVDQYSY